MSLLLALVAGGGTVDRSPSVTIKPQDDFPRAVASIARTVIYIRGGEGGVAAEASPAPVVVTSAVPPQARVTFGAVISKGVEPQAPAVASPQPYVVQSGFANLMARLDRVAPTALRGGPPDVIVPPPAPVPVVVSAQYPVRIVTARIFAPTILGVREQFVPDPLPPPYVPGRVRSDAYKRRKREEEERERIEAELAEARAAQHLAAIAQVIQDAEEAEREIRRAEMRERIAALRTNLNVLKDLE